VGRILNAIAGGWCNLDISKIILMAVAPAAVSAGEKIENSQRIRDEQYAQLNAWVGARVDGVVDEFG
jgi:hypothetical protein